MGVPSSSSSFSRQANQVAQYLMLAPKAAGNLAAIGFCMARSCVSGVMPWNLSRTWRTLREVASVETARSYENPQPLRDRYPLSRARQ